MFSVITTLLGLFGPLIQWGIKSLIKSGKVSDEDKQWLLDAYTILNKKNFNDIQRAKELEKKLPEMEQEMDDIEAGKKPYPWDEPDDKA